MFEKALEQSMFQPNSEKTFIDKLLAKDDVNALRELVKKPKLTRQDLLEILYLLTSAESKLLNFGEWDRYVILKFFVWLREFVQVCEEIYDYQDRREKYIEEGKFERDVIVEELFETATLRMQHCAKFLIDLYLNINRTSLSLGGSAFKDMLNNKYEVSYTGQGVQPAQPIEAPPQKFFGRR